MKEPIQYINRTNGEIHQEKIYFEPALRFLYGSPIGKICSKLLASFPFFSKFYGWWQTFPLTKRKIKPFVKKFNLDPLEFEKPLEEYSSFNDFFTRKLKPSARPLSNGLVLPADGRYLFFQNIEKCEGFFVKGKKFSLDMLLNNEQLAQKYRRGSLVLARLCPTDYHRFHFPCDCIPGSPVLINGPLYSVNPIALKQKIEFLAENKRMITHLRTKQYGEILYIEIGATNVGSIQQTYTPNQSYKKGEEKGFFSFGGSSIILLFQEGKIQIERNLLKNSEKKIETLCQFGQSIE